MHRLNVDLQEYVVQKLQTSSPRRTIRALCSEFRKVANSTVARAHVHGWIAAKEALIAFPILSILEVDYELESQEQEEDFAAFAAAGPSHLRSMVIFDSTIDRLSGIHRLKALESLLIHQSAVSSLDGLEELTNLVTLSIENCGSLVSLPAVSGMKKLETFSVFGCGSLKSLPEGVEELDRVSTLDITNCFGVTQLPCKMDTMVSLETLILRGSGVSQLPDSLGQVAALKVIDLSCSEGLQIAVPVSSYHLLMIMGVANTCFGNFMRLPEELCKVGDLKVLVTACA